MNLRKLYNLREMNTFQVIAVTGLVMTGAANLILSLLNKQIPSFELLYPSWLVLFTFGLIRNLTANPHNDDHGHHH